MKRAACAGVFLLIVMSAFAVGAQVRHDSALFVVDVSGSVSDANQVIEAQRIIKEMNARFPGYVQSAGVMTFGNLDKPQMRWPAKVSDWDRAELASKADDFSEGDGPTPVGASFTGSEEGLANSRGKTALIMISDGMNNGYSDPVMKAEELKEEMGSDLCIFTIQLGNSEEGGMLLDEIVNAGDCGTATMASQLQSSAGVQSLVDYIFPPAMVKPAPRPKPKKPVKCKDSDQDGVCDSADQCQDTPRGATVDFRGCWVLKNVNFDTGKYNIKPQYEQFLDEVVYVLNQNPAIRVEIEGHTDAQGSDESNQTLSQNRAESVMRYLVSQGISQDRMSAKGYGETKPVADNETVDGRAKNRRVELTVLD